MKQVLYVIWLIFGLLVKEESRPSVRLIEPILKEAKTKRPLPEANES